MCIKIVNNSTITAYREDLPLEAQILGAQEIIVDYSPQDSSIDTFLNEISRICESGNSLDLKINVIHNDNLMGAKAKKVVTKLEKQLQINEFIKNMVKLQQNADRELESIATLCLRRMKNV